MQTELPTMLNVFEADFQLEYSDSYSGTVHRDTISIGNRMNASTFRDLWARVMF